jgi:hypothetical protein
MLQTFYLNISKVDRMLLLGTHLPQQPTAGRRRADADVQAGDAEGRERFLRGVRRRGRRSSGAGPRGCTKYMKCKRVRPYARIRADVRVLPLPIFLKDLFYNTLNRLSFVSI